MNIQIPRIRNWSSDLDLLSPIDESSIPRFKKWLFFNGFHEKQHQGFDYADYIDKNGRPVLGLPTETTVRAISDGLVAWIGLAVWCDLIKDEYFREVQICHGQIDLKNRDAISIYLHVCPLVRKGQRVSKGQPIATLYHDGKDMKSERLVHLHFGLLDALGTSEKYFGHPPIDPQRVLFNYTAS